MSNPAALSSIEIEAESTFAENVTTTATARLAIKGPVDVSGLVHNKIDSGQAQQYRNAGSQWILGTMGGSFTTEIYLNGHGSTMAGSPSLVAHETFLGNVIGNVALSASASTTLTGGTASVPTTTASGTFSAGGLCRVGSIADTKGGGQMYGITTHVTTSLTLLNALINTPANGDVLYPVTQIYPSETPTSTTVTTYRMQLLTANTRYRVYGCHPTSYSISGTNPGDIPTIKITWAVARWEYTTGTFPSTVTPMSTVGAAPIAGGSLHISDVGVVTRNARTFRNFSVDCQIGMETQKGPGGIGAYQDIVSCRRTVDKFKFSWTEDADANTTTPVLPGYGTAATSKVLCWTGSAVDGSAFGILARSVCISNVALQKMDANINRFMIEGYAYTGATTTNDLTLSAIVIGLA